MGKINVNSVIYDSIVDGPGLRTTIFTQGCQHGCKGCHNILTWAMVDKKLYEVDELIKEIKENSDSKKITISGGEPLLQLMEVLDLCQKLKAEGFNIWMYSGFTISEIQQSDKIKILDYIDVLIDGKFVEKLKDFSLLYRGSSNQKIINLTGTKF